MRARMQVPMEGTVELGCEAAGRVLQAVEHVTCTTGWEGRRWSLAALVEAVLKRTLPKPAGVRCGAWDKAPLDMAQQRCVRMLMMTMMVMMTTEGAGVTV